MKKAKSILALLLALILVAALAACGQKGAEPPANSPSDSQAPSAPASPDDAPAPDESYDIGMSNIGAGVWIVDLHEQWNRYFMEGAGMNFTSTSANFLSDQMVKDVQNFVNAGVDGYIYYGGFGTIAPAVSDLLGDAKIYWANMDQQIPDDVLDYVHENPYYCGTTYADSYSIAKDLAQMAIDMGYRKAGMMAGAVGDTLHDIRLKSFQETFEAGGGEIVAVARCSDPSEAAQKGDDIVAAHGKEFDCFYAINMDFIMGVLNAMENYGLTKDDMMCFCSDCDAEGLQLINDGALISQAYLNVVEACAADALVINALDGHKILNDEGGTPEINCAKTWTITPETTKDYETYWLNSYPITLEAFEALLYRNNPDVSYQDIYDFVDGYNYDSIMAMQQ